MTGDQRLAVAPHQVGVLVLVEADPVAGAVDEGVAVAPFGDELAGHGVDVLAGGAHLGCGDRRGLGLLEHVVEVAELG